MPKRKIVFFLGFPPSYENTIFLCVDELYGIMCDRKRPIDALAVKKVTYSLSDNLKSRDACASKNLKKRDSCWGLPCEQYRAIFHMIKRFKFSNKVFDRPPN